MACPAEPFYLAAFRLSLFFFYTPPKFRLRHLQYVAHGVCQVRELGVFGLVHRDHCMAELFAESQLKIERAMKHIDDLSSMLTAFAQGYAHEVFIEHDPNGGGDVLKVRQGILPTEFLLTLGDALHNLRS
jgi:hypothetical protein